MVRSRPRSKAFFLAETPHSVTSNALAALSAAEKWPDLHNVLENLRFHGEAEVSPRLGRSVADILLARKLALCASHAYQPFMSE